MSLNEDKSTGELYTALLIVNWNDDNLTKNTKLNLIAYGISLSEYDDCDITNLWTGE